MIPKKALGLATGAQTAPLLSANEDFTDYLHEPRDGAESSAESAELRAESAAELRAESDSAGHAAGSRVARFFRETSHTEGV